MRVCLCVRVRCRKRRVVITTTKSPCIYQKMLFLVFMLLILVNFQPSLSDNGHEPVTSPRKTLLNVLYLAGCTNKVLAHFAIDAAEQNIPASTIIQRLNGIAKYDPNQMAKWWELWHFNKEEEIPLTHFSGYQLLRHFKHRLLRRLKVAVEDCSKFQLFCFSTAQLFMCSSHRQCTSSLSCLMFTV